MEEDGFQLVKSKKNKKQKNKLEDSKPKIQGQEEPLSRKEKDDFVRKLKAAQSTFEHSDFFQDFLRTWTRIFDKKENKEAISKIICLGLGNFAQNPHSVSAQIASKFQLSFLLALLKTFSVQGHVFDPVLTKCEKEILTALGFETPEENLEGRYQVEEDQDKYTLFYLPHCPKQLTNNILWANWESLQNCVIIGNSFNSCVLNLSKRQLESVSYLRQASKFVKEEVIQNNFQYPDVFNNLSLHRFESNLNPDSKKSSEPPKYPETDLEFIRSNGD